ncbi:MAG TPA: hypothetical protein PLF40_06365 [Kofleriaceae bacterium]|nr:hypothetical protein [Kofleriaceae bacterium]
MKRLTLATAVLSALLFAPGCADSQDAVTDDSNPFTEEYADAGKEDTGYLNPDGVEVEVDIEGDAIADRGEMENAPAMLAQFALTELRNRGVMYLESLAEDTAGVTRAEWLIDGQWKFNADVPANATRKRWRIRGVNAVALFGQATAAKLGATYTSKVPLQPFTVYADAGTKCADNNDHIGLSQDVYWYRWEPSGICTIPTQDLKLTVSKAGASATTKLYPEYDRLLADKKFTAVMIFGQVGDGAIDPNDLGMRQARSYASKLVTAKFKEVPGPVGRRFEKTVAGNLVQIDVYAPTDFSGLGDFAHFGNFQKAISEHEFISYAGHSMLGASDFWARPTYPNFYQIMMYGGCLGYEYYVRPILHGKGDSWKNLDMISSVVEVSAAADEYAVALSKIIYAIGHGSKSSWRDILVAIRANVGDSTFGVSGVRDNCYTPTGSRCSR